MKYHQGLFKPTNSKKYVGDIKNIVFRSRLEFMYMRLLDHDPNIIQWSSEEFVIMYRSPIDARMHRYFVDFFIKRKNGDDIETVMIEMKPLSQTKPPIKKKSQNRFLKESIEWSRNSAKWNAAEDLAKKKGWKFEIVTELDVGLKY